MVIFIGGWSEDIDGVDYVYQNYTMSFRDGDRSKSLLIRTIDDNVVEGDEEYNLVINNGSFPFRVKAEGNQTTTIIIENDDGM